MASQTRYRQLLIMKLLNTCKNQSENRCKKTQWQNVNKQLSRHVTRSSFHLIPAFCSSVTRHSNLHYPCFDVFKRGKQRLKFIAEQLRDAVRAVSSGVPASSAAKDFGIPRATLLRRMKGTFPNQCGARPAFTKDEEDTFATLVKGFEAMHLPLNRTSTTWESKWPHRYVTAVC